MSYKGIKRHELVTDGLENDRLVDLHLSHVLRIDPTRCNHSDNRETYYILLQSEIYEKLCSIKMSSSTSSTKCVDVKNVLEY